MTVASLNTRNFINVVRGLKPDTHYPFERAVWTGSVYPHLWTTIDRLTTTNILMWSYKIDLLDVNFYEIIIRAIFLPRDATQSAVLLRRIACPSVRPSVTWRYRDHIGRKSLKIISRLVSMGRSLRADSNIPELLQRKHLIFWSELWSTPCWIERRRHSMAICSRMVRDSATVTMGSL